MDELVQSAINTINRGSKSFAIAARLFNAKTYRHAIMLYAWCRHCDDEIDGQVLGHGQQSPEPDEQMRRLAQIQQQTRDALAGRSTEHPAFQGLQLVYKACAIPERYPLELLEGFEMDIHPKPYVNLDDTLTYSYHVAGTVGAMMACVMGVRDSTILDRAVDLGLAFQLTNICRDLLQDAQDQRVYLPSRWLEEAGAPKDLSLFPKATSALAKVCARVLDEADRYYESAAFGIARLPWRSAWAVSTAAAVYRDIGRLVTQQGSRAWTGRTATGKARKLWLALTSLVYALYVTKVEKNREIPPRQLLWSAPEAHQVQSENS